VTDTDGSDAGTRVDDQLVALIPPLRRYVAALVREPHDQQDVVQETLARTLAASPRLGQAALTGYAFTVARNLVASRGRDQARFRTHAPRLIDLTHPPDPEAMALAREERAALGEALAALPPEHRDVLVAHAVDGIPLSTVSTSEGSSGAIAAKLARARARMRVDYVVALRGVRLPSERCRQVLLALSAGDRRRQAALDAGQHLLTCAVCPELSEPLVARRRALAGVLPLAALPMVAEALQAEFGVAGAAKAVAAGGAAAATPAKAATAGTAAAAAGVGQLATAAAAGAGQIAAAVASVASVLAGYGAVALSAPSDAVSTALSAEVSGSAPARDVIEAAGGAPADQPPNVSTGPACLDHIPAPTALEGAEGEAVCLSGAVVTSVPADEGFWVRADDGDRIWVQLAVPGSAGSESPQDIDVGQHVDVDGVLTPHGDGFAERVGVTLEEGAAALVRRDVHVHATYDDVRVTVN
jgi:RNA polymerase sigma factor (sigma-70 family)